MAGFSIPRFKRIVIRLQADRLMHADALAEIDATLAELGIGTAPAIAAGTVGAPRRGRPPGRPKVSVAKASKGRKPRGTFAQTGKEFLLAMLHGKKLVTGEINEAWKQAGRSGNANITLMELVKAGRLKRRKVRGGRGSHYSVA